MKEYSLIPKHKSDVQFNGDIIYNKSWIVPYIINVRNEFDQRYDEIKKQYDKLIDEVYWNNIIYNIELRFQPVIGNSYYLYKDDEKYIISIIGPDEWKKEFVGTFQFEYTGKWIKC
jgi:hypothetical protein